MPLSHWFSYISLSAILALPIIKYKLPFFVFSRIFNFELIFCDGKSLPFLQSKAQHNQF